jgi:hypothetical protein
MNQRLFNYIKNLTGNSYPDTEINEIERICNEELQKEFDWMKERSITWSEEDFEMRAVVYEESHDLPIGNYYDRTKFTETLLFMIHCHDADSGIQLRDVDYHLDEYCKL